MGSALSAGLRARLSQRESGFISSSPQRGELRFNGLLNRDSGQRLDVDFLS